MDCPSKHVENCDIDLVCQRKRVNNPDYRWVLKGSNETQVGKFANYALHIIYLVSQYIVLHTVK